MQMSLSSRLLGLLPVMAVLLLGLACADSSDSIGKAPTPTLVSVHSYDPDAGGFKVISLEWRHEDAEGYSYQMQRAAPHEGRDFEFVQWSWGRNFDDNGFLLGGPFAPGETYVYRMRRVRNIAGPWSDELSVTTPAFVPPENLTATYDEEPGVVVLEWDGGEDLGQQWILSRRRSESEEFFDIGNAWEHRYEDSAVAPGASYEYKVFAGHGEYGPSAARFVSIELPKAAGPVMRDASTGDPDSITVHWDRFIGAGGGQVDYDLYRTMGDPEDEESYELIADRYFGQQNGLMLHVDEDIEHGRWYYYRARARFTDSFRPDSGQTYSHISENYVAGWAGPTSPDEPPSAPVGLTATGQNFDLSIALEWAPTPGATGYRVFRLLFEEDTDPNEIDDYMAGFQPLADVAASGGVVRYTDQDAEAGRGYYYYVRAENDVGAGPPSEVVVGHWGNAAVPGKPAISATHGDFSDAVVVSWPEASNARWYRVYRTTSHAEPEVLEVLSDWITDTQYVHFTDESVCVSVQALSEEGIPGELSSPMEGFVYAGAPPYSD